MSINPTSGIPFATSKINASLQNHTVTPQDLNNWLVYCDDNGQLIGWITATKLKTFETCLLRADHANNFQTFIGLESYQEAISFIVEVS